MSVKVDQIIRTERKSTEISVSVEGYIIVRAPLGEPIEKIEEIIESKKFWLLRTQQITKAKYLNDLHKKYLFLSLKVSIFFTISSSEI